MIFTWILFHCKLSPHTLVSRNSLASALIDNVPLVAATMGMYDLTDFATDDKLWQLIALCAGTGGSILVIGSASGVALMGLEKVVSAITSPARLCSDSLPLTTCVHRIDAMRSHRTFCGTPER